MVSDDDVFLKSKAYKYFSSEMKESKVVRDTLIAFEEVLNIKKNIRSIYNTDEPDKVRMLIGTNINGISVSQKDFDYVLLIHNTYNSLYDKCKKLLNDSAVAI